MKKNVVVVLLVVFCSYFVLGAYSGRDGYGRYQLQFGPVDEEIYEHGRLRPKLERKMQMFKIDSDTGQVWVYKDEYRFVSNRQIHRLKGFVELPVDEKFSENPYNK